MICSRFFWWLSEEFRVDRIQVRKLQSHGNFPAPVQNYAKVEGVAIMVTFFWEPPSLAQQWSLWEATLDCHTNKTTVSHLWHASVLNGIRFPNGRRENWGEVYVWNTITIIFYNIYKIIHMVSHIWYRIICPFYVY